MIKKNILLAMILLVSYGCVGVIQDGTKSTTKADNTFARVVFDGAEYGGAVSHNKLWVAFKPAVGGSGRFIYHAFIDGLPTPVASLNSDATAINSSQYYILELENLRYYSPYDVQVKVYDKGTARYDDNKKSILLWTSKYFLPDFDGVKEITNVGGIAAQTQLHLSWAQAQAPVVTSGDIFSTIHSVSGYNIYYSTVRAEIDQIAQITDLNLLNLADYPKTKVVAINDASVTEYIIGASSGNELSIDTEYFVLIRARQSSSPPRYEYNQVILSNSTLSEAAVDFSGITNITIPSNRLGFTDFTINWQQCVACSVYKVYAVLASEDIGVIHPINHADKLVSTITNMSLTSAQISTSLAANQNYSIYMLACKDNNCGWNGSTLNNNEVKGLSRAKQIKLAPSLSTLLSQPGTPTVPSGIAGLTSLDLTWSLDRINGYYSFVRVYQVLDKNGVTTDLTNPNLVKLSQSFSITQPYLDTSAPPLTYDGDQGGIRIKNLVTNQESCFLILPFIGHPDVPIASETTIPTSSFPNIVCGTPQYLPPVFGANSLLPSCTVGATSVTINWTAPETPNLFTSYEIYRTDENTAFAFEGDDGAWIDNGNKYDRVAMVSTAQTSAVITSLGPNTTYGFGINTYYQTEGGQVFRSYSSLPTATVYCKTLMPEVNHGSWYHALGVGKKIDGLTGVALPEIIHPDRKIPMETAEYGVPSGLVEADLDGGMIYLAFQNFEIDGMNLYMSELENLDSSSGYTVFRLAKSDLMPSEDPFDVDDLVWQRATRLRFKELHPAATAGYSADPYMFVATPAITSDTANSYYIAPSKYNIVNNVKTYDVVDYPPTSGETYYYKVAAAFSGQLANFATQVRHNVISVIAPPNNMTHAHRWILNRSVCERMGRGLYNKCSDSDPGKCSDTDMHYRCEFNGLTSVTDSNGDGTPDSPPLYGAYDRYYDMGHHLIIDRFQLAVNFTRNCTTNTRLVGTTATSDCIGNAAPTTYPINNTNLTDINIVNVYHDRNSAPTMVRLPGMGTNWVQLNSLANTTEILFGDTPGTGYGKLVSTNNANMPPMGNLSQLKAWYLCRSHSVTIDGQSYAKRVPRRREQLPSSYFDPRTPSLGNVMGGTFSDQSCLVGDKAMKGGGLAQTNLNLNDTRYPGYPFDVLNASNPRTYVSGSSTRLSNPTPSSSLCVSKFGLQDHMGSLTEWLTDTYRCWDGAACTNNTVTSDNTLWAVDVGDAGQQAQDNELFKTGKELIRTGNGTYFSTRQTPTAVQTAFGHFNNNGSTLGINFVSIPYGYGLHCTTGCAEDDQLVTAKATGSVAATIFSYLSDGGILPFQSFDPTVTNSRPVRTLPNYYSVAGTYTTQTYEHTTSYSYEPHHAVPASGTRCTIPFRDDL